MNYSLVDKIAVIVSALGAIVVGMMFFSIDVFALSFFVTHLSLRHMTRKNMYCQEIP